MKKLLVLVSALSLTFFPACKDKETQPVVPPTITVTYKISPDNVSNCRLKYTSADGSEIVVEDNTGAAFSKDISVSLPFTAKASVVAYRKTATDPVSCNVLITGGQSFYQQSQTITADSVVVEVSGTFQ